MPNMLPAGASQINVRLPTDLLRQVWQASAAADLKTSQWVRQAIREKLERERDRWWTSTTSCNDWSKRGHSSPTSKATAADPEHIAELERELGMNS